MAFGDNKIKDILKYSYINNNVIKALFFYKKRVQVSLNLTINPQRYKISYKII